MKKQLFLMALMALMPLTLLRAQSECDTITDEMMPWSTDFSDETPAPEESNMPEVPECWYGADYYWQYNRYPLIDNDNSSNVAGSNGKGVDPISGEMGNTYIEMRGGKNDTAACYLVLPAMDSVSNKMVSLYAWRRNNYAEIDLGVMTDPQDTSTFVTLHHFVPAGQGGTGAWSYHEGAMKSYTGNGHYVAIRAYSPNSMPGGYPVFIDNITVDFAPCDRAQDVRVENITYTEATIVVDDTSNANNYHVMFCNTADMVETDFYIMDTNAYLLTDLEAGNEYRVTLYTSCADGSETTPFIVTFRTPCEVMTHDELPFTFDFDDMATGGFDPICWVPINEVPLANYTISVSNTHHGESGHGVEFRPYSYHQYSQYIVLPEMDSLNDLVMTFWVTGHGENTLDVGVITDPTNTATFTSLLDIATIPYNDGVWGRYDVDFTSYTGEGGRIAFKAGVGGAFGYSCYIDDIQIVRKATCPAPLGVAATGIMQTEATLTIEDTASENATYEMTVSGPDGEWTEVLYTTTYQLSEGVPGGQYSVEVTKLCDDGTRPLSVSTSFTLLCEPVDMMPWVVDFQNDSDLDCWKVFSYNGLNSDNWRIGEMTTNAFGDVIDSNRSVESPYGSSTVACNEWLVTPPIALAEGATGYTLFYDYTAYQYNNTPRMDVRISTTDCYDTASFTYLLTTETYFDNDLEDGEDFVSRQFNLDTFAGETIYIAFIHNSLYDNGVKVDNVAIRNANLPEVEIVGPDEASSEDMTEYIAHMITGTTGEMTYTWTSTMEAAGQAESEKSGDTLRIVYHASGTDTITVVVYNGIGLDTAMIIVPVMDCSVAESRLPWSEDFEGYNHSYSGPVAPQCWAIKSINNGGSWYPNINSTSTGHNSSKCYAITDASGNHPAVAVLPPFEMPLDTLMLTFWSRTVHSVFTGYGNVEVGYVSSSTAMDGFTMVEAIGFDTIWQQHQVRFPEGVQGRIALRFTSNAISYIDDITVDIAPEICLVPEVTIDSIFTDRVYYHTTNIDSTEVLTICSYVTDGTTQTTEITHSQNWATWNLLPATEYELHVRHVCHVGDTSDEAVLQFTTLAECTAPEGLTVTNVTATTASISWTAVPTATRYTVRIGEAEYTANGTNYTLNNLAPQTTYTVGVQAHCPSGDSPWSETGFTTEQDNSGIGTVSEGMNVSLRPNPATDRVVVSTSAAARISIVDLSGREVMTIGTEGSEATIDISRLARGAYFVRISTQDGTAVLKLMAE